jgi:hypothetical protein
LTSLASVGTASSGAKPRKTEKGKRREKVIFITGKPCTPPPFEGKAAFDPLTSSGQAKLKGKAKSHAPQWGFPLIES